MEKNIILAGVGGQGILSIAYVLDNAALDAGYFFKQAEVHGMSQRGGAVQSNLRYADTPIRSDLIPVGDADMVLSVEPLEAMRYWHYLKPSGWVVSSITPLVNIPDYPEMESILGDLVGFENIILVDAARIARAAGNLRAQNMAVIGAASILLDFTPEQLLVHVEGLFARKGEKIVAVNRRAFGIGRATAEFFRGLTDKGIGRMEALRLSSKLEPESIEGGHATAWAEVLGKNPEALDRVLAAETVNSADSETFA